PPNDLKEFATYVRANAEKLNMAHAGVGSITHFTCLLLNSILGVKPTRVPFKRPGPAISALIGGQVDYMCNVAPDVVQQIQNGAFKAYAIGSLKRNAALPEVPTSEEAGLPQFQASAWNALFAPKGTPKAILDKLSDALDKALDDENTQKRLLNLGSEIPDKPRRGQQPLATLVKDEIARWTPIIKARAAEAKKPRLRPPPPPPGPRAASPAASSCIWPRALQRCRPPRAWRVRKPIRRGRCTLSSGSRLAVRPTWPPAWWANGCPSDSASHSSSRIVLAPALTSRPRRSCARPPTALRCCWLVRRIQSTRRSTQSSISCFSATSCRSRA